MPMSSSDERQIVHEQKLREEFFQRMQYVRAIKDLQNAEIAAGVWGSESTISDWFRGKSIPEGIKLIRLTEFWPDVNFHWLLTGRGDPLVLPSNGEQYGAGAREVITQAQLFLADMKARLAERQARTSGAIAVAEVRREIARSGAPTPPRRGARRS